MKYIGSIFLVALLLGLYQIAGYLWGAQARVNFVVGIFASYALLSLAVFIMRCCLRSRVRRMEEATRTHLLREYPKVAEEAVAKSSISWWWKVLDVVLGITFAWVPPLIVSLARRQPLSLDSEFTGYHFLAMAGGVGIYLLGRAYAIRQWQHKHGVRNDAV